LKGEPTDVTERIPVAAGTRETALLRLSSVALALGGAALGLVVLGPLAVIASHGFVPSERLAAGITSPTTGAVSMAAILTGAGAIALGFGTYRRMPTKASRERAISGAVLGIQAVLLATVLLWFRAGDPERFSFHFFNFEKLVGYGGAFLNAAKNTVILAFVGEAGGIVLGLILALLAISSRPVVRAPARVYINFFRGTPLIWQLSTIYFLFLFGFRLRFDTFVVAMIVFALNTAGYAAEVFRAGIQSVERAQMEAARSLGMSYLQAMRYAIVPQAFRRVIPPLMNEFVILIKDTSLVIALGLSTNELELYNLARRGYSDTFNATFFVAAAAGYLAITLPLIRVVNILERRLRSGLVGIGG
jgi:His/Glu/Gln/Arg/opine family amino acid ABC transporter permease subunit